MNPRRRTLAPRRGRRACDNSIESPKIVQEVEQPVWARRDVRLAGAQIHTVLADGAVIGKRDIVNVARRAAAVEEVAVERRQLAGRIELDAGGPGAVRMKRQR